METDETTKDLRKLEMKSIPMETIVKKSKSKTHRKPLEREIIRLKADLAWKLLDNGQYEKALGLYASLPWSEDKYNAVARALTEMGRHKEAGQILDRGLAKFPHSHALWVAKGNLSLGLGDHLTALGCYEKVIMLFPLDSSVALYGKAMAPENLGRFKKAILILDRLIKKHPKDPLYLIERGHCALKMGCHLDALRFYRQAMSIWRHSGQFQEGVALYSGICTAYIDLHMKKEALEVAIEGLKELPGHPILYYNAGRAYCGMGMSEEAMEILKKGLERFPEDQDMRELLKEIEEVTDSPDGGIRPSFLGLVLLALLIRRKLKKK